MTKYRIPRLTSNRGVIPVPYVESLKRKEVQRIMNERGVTLDVANMIFKAERAKEAATLQAGQKKKVSRQSK